MHKSDSIFGSNYNILIYVAKLGIYIKDILDANAKLANTTKDWF